MSLVDSYGRNVDYLRISITDTCNLNCRYCSPPFSGRAHLHRDEILSYEELTMVAQAAVAAGISKIRITGGEPLVRRGVVDFCRMLSGIDGLADLSLTTNGIRLGELAGPLFAAGIRRLNVSLDTLRRDRFAAIAGRDSLDRVLKGIERAESVGFDPIKINTVVMRGINHDEVADLARLTFNKPYQVRFIELMPFQNSAGARHRELYMPIREIMGLIPGLTASRVGQPGTSAGPARLCILPGAIGKIGFIAPLSWHFCGSCNRLRLTADGKIRTCLFSQTEIDLKTPLRNGATPTELIDIFKQAVQTKPRRHRLKKKPFQCTRQRGMYAIGG